MVERRQTHSLSKCVIKLKQLEGFYISHTQRQIIRKEYWVLKHFFCCCCSKTFLNEHEKQRKEWITLTQWVVIWSRECTGFSRVWLFVTPRTVAHPAPLSMGFSRQESWNRLPCLPPGDLPDPGIEPTSFLSPALVVGLFTTSTTWEAWGWWWGRLRGWQKIFKLNKLNTGILIYLILHLLHEKITPLNTIAKT